MQKAVAILIMLFIAGYAAKAQAGSWTELNIPMDKPEMNEAKNVIFGMKPDKPTIITFNVEDRTTKEYPINDKFQTVKADLKGNYWALVKTKSANGLKSTFMLESSEDLNWWKGYSTTVNDYDNAYLVPSKKYKDMVYIVGFTSPFYYDVTRCGINDRICVKLNSFQITDGLIANNNHVSTKTDGSNEFITVVCADNRSPRSDVKYYEFSPYTDYTFKKVYKSISIGSNVRIEGDYAVTTGGSFMLNLFNGSEFRANPISHLLELFISQLPLGTDITETGSGHQIIGVLYNDNKLLTIVDTPIYITTGEFLERQIWEIDQDYNFKFITTVDLKNPFSYTYGNIFKLNNSYIVAEESERTRQLGLVGIYQ